MNFIFGIVIVGIFGLMYYQIQKNVGKDQARNWQEFVNSNPNLFKKRDRSEKLNVLKTIHRELYNKEFVEPTP